MRKKNFSVSENYANSGHFSVFRSSEWLKSKNIEDDGKNKNSPCSWKIVCIFVIVLTVASAMLVTSLSIIYSETYVWQSTILADYVLPVNRTTCLDFSKVTEGFFNKVPIASKIAVVMLYQDSDGSWDDKLIARVIANRNRYCRKNGYTLLNQNKLIDRWRPVAWSKLLAVEDALKTFDYVMYIDMDVVIMDIHRKIEDFIAYDLSSRSPAPAVLVESDFIMTQDWSGPNTGVWITHKSTFSKWFLDTAWAEGARLVLPKTEDGVSLPFEYEQRVFHYMLNTDVWRARGLPSYEPPSDVEVKSTTDIAKHFSYLPQCAFNSYAVHPLYLNLRADRQVSQYVPGDFLIHFAGKKGRAKTDLLNHYLTIAENDEGAQTP